MHIRLAAFLALGIAMASPAGACPVCLSETGVQVRALLVADFWSNLAATFAPVPVLVACVGALRAATPWLVGTRSTDD
jgi:hypothetical protein